MVALRVDSLLKIHLFMPMFSQLDALRAFATDFEMMHIAFSSI